MVMLPNIHVLAKGG
ncbi:unnamed protein product [Amaranthus hypochondriacus]